VTRSKPYDPSAPVAAAPRSPFARGTRPAAAPLSRCLTTVPTIAPVAPTLARAVEPVTREAIVQGSPVTEHGMVVASRQAAPASPTVVRWHDPRAAQKPAGLVGGSTQPATAEACRTAGGTWNADGNYCVGGSDINTEAACSASGGNWTGGMCLKSSERDLDLVGTITAVGTTVNQLFGSVITLINGQRAADLADRRQAWVEEAGRLESQTRLAIAEINARAGGTPEEQAARQRVLTDLQTQLATLQAATAGGMSETTKTLLIAGAVVVGGVVLVKVLGGRRSRENPGKKSRKRHARKGRR
jgi:hypothetical protein